MRDQLNVFLLRLKMYFLLMYLARCVKTYNSMVMDSETDWDDLKTIGKMLMFFCKLDDKFYKIMILEEKIKNKKGSFYQKTIKRLQDCKESTESLKETIEIFLQGKV